MPRQGLTRKDVLRACFRLIDEKGFEGFSMHELARRLDIKTASLYNHIENESTLLSRIAQTATERLASALTEAVGDRSGEEGLRALCAAWWDYAEEHPGLYAVAMRTAEWGEGAEEPSFVLPVKKLAGKDVALGEMILSALHGAVALTRGGILPPEEKEQRIDRITESLVTLWNTERNTK